jgi:hypothetical protein
MATDKDATVYPPGRRCEEETCPTILNRYNPGPLCLLHEQKAGHDQADAEAEELRQLMEAA